MDRDGSDPARDVVAALAPAGSEVDDSCALEPDPSLEPEPSLVPPGELAEPAQRPRRRRRRRRLEPAFVSGTSSEFLGRRPLPRAASERSVVFILGPLGVGKSLVAQRLLQQPEVLHLTGDELQEALTTQARRRSWRDDIRRHPALILDGPCFLHRRPAVVRMLRELLRLRTGDGLRTMVCEGPDRAPMTELMDVVDADDRATVALRFPVGRGRRRFALHAAAELGLDPHYAAWTDHVEPWTYQAVLDRLRTIREDVRKERRRRRRHAVRVCDQLKIPRHHADRALDLDPYDKDEAVRVLTEVRDDLVRRRKRRKRKRIAARAAAEAR